MSTDTCLRQALSNLLAAYATSNGEDHPAYLKAEAALNGKKTHRLGSGPSIIRDEARRSGTETFQLLDPKPSSELFVPALCSAAGHPTGMRQPVDCPTAIHTDFDPTQVTGSDSSLEAHSLRSGTELVDVEMVEQQLQLRRLVNTHPESLNQIKTGINNLKERNRAPVSQTQGVDIPLLNAEILKNALEMTGCDDEADLIDMANVGKSLMERIDSLVGMPGPYFRWSPADDPAEIVFDLVNDLDELREENMKLKAALEKISSPTQTTDLLWWQVEARAALATTEGTDNAG